ncbi:DUF3392 domain-containing protein [Marinomonas epiphytica]
MPFSDFNLRFAYFIQPYLSDIALALVATCLVIYGDKINAFIKRQVSSWVFVARIMAFILMCTFGYGFLTLWGQPIVLWTLLQIDLVYRPVSVLICFSILGFLAERKRYL